MKKYKILLLYPECPDNFWGFKHAIKFIAKKALHPPLGLITIASMLPKNWELKLIDMNVQKLKDKHLEWANFVFISAMTVQKESVKKIAKKCRNSRVKTVAGGPLFTASHEEFKEIDHFVLNEGEITLRNFLSDLEKNTLKKTYSTTKFPDIENTLIPRRDLVNKKKYVSMNIQYSRGCPFNCEFCDITTLFGRAVRTKSKDQILKELNQLYSLNWRGNVFFVDDNFIGNKVKLKNEVLPAIIKWQKEKNYPFIFSTEASVNLSDDDELMDMMVNAGFEAAFLGIETPNEESLTECGKFQNKNRDLVKSIKKIQRAGIEVTGGFIVGFDNDTPSIFQRQIDFIQKSGIVTAMVGLLNAPKDTLLYKRLKLEGRLLKNITGSNTDFSMNFIPKMNHEKLLAGYKNIIKGIYSTKPYYERVKTLLKEKKPKIKKPFHFKIVYLKAFIDSIIILGIKDKGRKHFWKLFLWSIFKKPKTIRETLAFAIQGYHFRKIFKI